ERMEGPFERLSGLDLGQQGTVVAISPVLRGPERRRMLDLGLIPGTVVTAEIRSPGGDPTGYRIRGAVIALRQEQADQIQIERVA
ncbi:MAG: FeoA family protein, partial [Thermoanaerobaculia bacterium]